MEKTINIAIGLLIIVVLLRILKSRPVRRLPPGFVLDSNPSQQYQVSDAEQETLKCRFLVDQVLKDDYYPHELINKRMHILQSNKPGYDQLLNRGRSNGWSDFEAIYNEALRGLIFDGTLEYAPQGIC